MKFESHFPKVQTVYPSVSSRSSFNSQQDAFFPPVLCVSVHESVNTIVIL